MEEISEMEREVMAAERAVEDAKEKLVAELEAASETGREALALVVHKATPLAIAAAALAGVGLVVGAVAIARASFSRPRGLRYLAIPKQRSLFGQVMRRALTSAAGTLAAAIARRAIASLRDKPAQLTNGHSARNPWLPAVDAEPVRR